LPAFGQDIYPTSLDPKPPYSKEKISEHENPSLADMDLRLRISSKDVYFPNYWNTYANKPHVTIIYRYKGLRGLAHKHLMKQANKYYDKVVQNTVATSYMYGHQKKEHFDPQHQFSNRRYFFDHFPVEKGGATVRLAIIGKTHNIFSLGPLSLTTAGKLSLNGWHLSLSSARSKNTSVNKSEENIFVRKNEITEYSLAIRPPRTHAGNNWTISTSFKAGVRLRDFRRDNKSSVTCGIKIIGRSGINQVPWIIIKIKGKVRPFKNDYGVRITATILRF